MSLTILGGLLFFCHHCNIQVYPFPPKASDNDVTMVCLVHGFLGLIQLIQQLFEVQIIIFVSQMREMKLYVIKLPKDSPLENDNKSGLGSDILSHWS